MSRSIQAGFLASVARFPDRPALSVGGIELSYTALHTAALRIAATLAEAVPTPRHPLTGVLGHRTTTAYAAILGTLLRGQGYVPLNPDFPAERLAVMLNRAGVDTLVVDRYGLPKLLAVLARAEGPVTVLLPDDETDLELPAPHRLLRPADRPPGGVPASTFEPVPTRDDAIANLLFTSGSTGVPKAVMVAQRNLVRFLDVVLARYDLRPEDRFSQLFELVFDLHGFDLFAAWWVGACVCCPSKEELVTVGQFLTDARLTVWFSVPSTAVLLKRLGFLEPGALPGLRFSLFCGEALPADATRAWADAAPNSVVENLYGPTELTLACTLYRWDRETSPGECENGLVPIGEPFDGMTVRVIDPASPELACVAPGEIGELLVAGPQVTLGYWCDPEKTAAAFVVPPGTDAIHYRTGDLVRRATPLTFLGRADTQIKVRGYRIELGDVEAALRAAAQTDFAVALGHPKTDAGYDGIVGFVAGVALTSKQLKAEVAKRLPAYMTPGKYHVLAEFPLNANGKVDRKALRALVESGTLK